MINEKKLRIESMMLHSGQAPDEGTGACSVPIYQTSSYAFSDTDEAAGLFELEKEGFIYTRISNPTTDVLEKRVAAIDGGVGAVAFSSGMSAISIALMTLAGAGDEIVASSSLYGGTYTLFKYTFADMGIKVRFVDISDEEALQSAITEKTKAVYAESIGNPNLIVTDLERVAAIAHNVGVPFVLDNTVSPYILRPFEFGVDVAVYSATKFLGGHGNSIGGLVVDSGKFDWGNGRFPRIAGPNKSYHGKDFYREFGKAAFLMMARAVYLRDLGSCLSPFNAFLLLQGLETLHLRMPRHVENALKLAEYLKQHEKVSWVNYPGSNDSKNKPLADKYFKYGPGALIGFGVKGGMEAGRKFIEGLNMVTHLANIGDARSLAIHPASTTHQQLSEEERLAAGISDDFIRFSVGIEHIDDICADLDSALSGI